MRTIELTYQIKAGENYYSLSKAMAAVNEALPKIAEVLKLAGLDYVLPPPEIRDTEGKPASKKGRPPKGGISIVRNDAA